MKEPYLAHSDLTGAIYIVVGNEKYEVTEQAKQAVKAIEQQPRIITCKECKYYRSKGSKYSYCTKRLNVDSVTDRYRAPDFYCADAELREVEE